jgi:hypothetical protein
MATENLAKTTIINELNSNLKTGFTKSVNVLFDDIIKYLKNRTTYGYRNSLYNKKWYEHGTIMSPVHIGYTGHKQNSVMVSNVELNKLFEAVDKKLEDEKIIVVNWAYEYITSNNVNYTLSIQFNLEVPPLETIEESTPNSPSHSPDKHEYDFKCVSC